MKTNNEQGFSLIELIIVIVVLGIISVYAIPYLQKAVNASQNSNMNASLKTAASTQVNFYSQNNRFARLGELNTMLAGALGKGSGDLTRGPFTVVMTPNSPTDADLRDEYKIIATRTVTGSDFPYVTMIDQSGRVQDNLFAY